LLVGLAAAAIDQATKVMVIYGLQLGPGSSLRLTPFLDLVLAWNKGISYSLFQQETAFGQWALIIFKAVAIALLWLWLARAGARLTAVALGLIVGGAIGNLLDPFLYRHQGVADFILFHVTTETIHFNWYIFNLADSAIVAGVAGLLYDSLLGERAAKAPRSDP
jgi:signal peptidase II